MSAWLTPRGPITTVQILLSMAAALGFGIAVGLITGSRWSLLVIPVLSMATFELARRGIDGPTVDGIHLTSTYGLIAFVLRRVTHALFVLGPLMLGIVYGRWLAHRLGHPAIAPMRSVGWICTGAATLLLVVVAGGVARPARTAPILGAYGGPLTGSIAEVIAIPVGGHQQTLMIRGARTTSPVLLYLAGGPGGTDLGAMRADSGLEQAFVVVVWEQRGTGKSYAALDPVDTLTLEQMLADTIAVSRYLRDRFGQDKIYLVGNSCCTILGTRAVQQHPELFHAYVGTGQMVSPRETDRMFYEDTVTWATQTGDTTLAATLRRNGPPPYANLLAYEAAITHEHDWNPYADLDASKEMPSNLFVPPKTASWIGSMGCAAFSTHSRRSTRTFRRLTSGAMFRPLPCPCTSLWARTKPEVGRCLPMRGSTCWQRHQKS